MRINTLEYIAPNQANPLGSLRVDVEVPVMFKPGQQEIAENSDKDVELSAATVTALNEVAQLIIKDLENTNAKSN